MNKNKTLGKTGFIQKLKDRAKKTNTGTLKATGGIKSGWANRPNPPKRKQNLPRNAGYSNLTHSQRIGRMGVLDKIETPYALSLMVPEAAVLSKIPGYATPVVSLHRKLVFRLTVNALGNFSAAYIVDQLNDNTMSTTGLYFNNAVGYDGTAGVAPSLQTTANPYNLPAGVAKAYRTVSSSILCRSLSSALNRKGDIHIAMVNGRIPVLNAIATADMTAVSVLSTITQMQSGRYTQAHIEKGYAARSIWLPQDISCLAYKLINSNEVSANAFATDNFISIIGIGLEAASTVEFELNTNFEVTPETSSVLLGMESICHHADNPQLAWRNILLQHPDKLTQSIFDNGCHVAELVNLTSSNIQDSIKKMIGVN
jgi:hypothetical protein